MRVVVDLQTCQTGSRLRDVCRYSLALTQEMARHCGEHELWLILSNRFPNTVDNIHADFAGLIPPERIRVFETPDGLAANTAGNAWRVRAAELLRESFLAELKPDLLYIANLFEGFCNDAVTSIGRLPRDYPIAVGAYDAAPLFLRAYCPTSDVFKEWRLGRITGVRQS